jgi:DNA-binding IscR family transcriptional regulator
MTHVRQLGHLLSETLHGHFLSESIGLAVKAAKMPSYLAKQQRTFSRAGLLRSDQGKAGGKLGLIPSESSTVMP